MSGRERASFRTGGGPALRTAAAVLAALVVEGEAAKRGRRDDGGSTRTAIVVMVMLFALCGGGIGWCLWLESRPQTSTVRKIMLVAVVLAILTEFCFCYLEVLKWWMAPVGLLLNVWGSLDAVLRFPKVYGFDSLFAVKQLVLLVAKAACYVISLKDFTLFPASFFALLLSQVVGMPLMYLLALPFDDYGVDERGAVVLDQDVLVWCYRGLADSKERALRLSLCRARMRRATVSVAQRVPAVGELFCKMDPSLRKSLQKSGRAV